jgi:hypothetical protein
VVDHYSEENHDDVEALLLGRTVTRVADNKLLLDDGTELTLVGNQGGCGCEAGDYELVELNGVDNIITRVEFFDSPGGDYVDGFGVYQIFVYADNVKVNLAKFEGTDGNGYYGTGYQITVNRPQIDK